MARIDFVEIWSADAGSDPPYLAADCVACVGHQRAIGDGLRHGWMHCGPESRRMSNPLPIKSKIAIANDGHSGNYSIFVILLGILIAIFHGNRLIKSLLCTTPLNGQK